MGLIVEWCLQVFPRTVLDKMPKVTINGEERPFCNKLLALKSFRSPGDDCFFCHADPRDHNLGDAVKAFLKAYGDAKKKQS